MSLEWLEKCRTNKHKQRNDEAIFKWVIYVWWFIIWRKSVAFHPSLLSFLASSWSTMQLKACTRRLLSLVDPACSFLFFWLVQSKTNQMSNHGCSFQSGTWLVQCSCCTYSVTSLFFKYPCAFVPYMCIYKMFLSPNNAGLPELIGFTPPKNVSSSGVNCFFATYMIGFILEYFTT